MKRLLFALVVILTVPAFVAAQCPDGHIFPTPPDSTAVLQNAVNAASAANNLAPGGCPVLLDRGPNGQDTYVLTQTIVLPSNVTVTKWPDTPGTITIQAGTNIDPDKDTNNNIPPFCDLADRGTRNVFCSTDTNKTNITITDLNFVPLSGVTVVKNLPDSNAGREVWAVKNGGSNLTFRENTVSNFTDALFVELDGISGSDLYFLNNGVNLADRAPLSGGMPSGGNAAFTVVNCGTGCPTPAVQSTIQFNGNTVVGPGSNILRAAGVVGGIVFDDNASVMNVEMKNNRVTQLDHGLFIAATCPPSSICNTVSGNRGDNNGNGLTISRSAAAVCSLGPTVTDLPASGMSITKNTFNSNSYDGGCIAAYSGVMTNPSPSLVMKDNIFNGNKNQCLENFSGVGPNGNSPGANICRGPGNNGPPPAPPGKGVHPGRGTT